MMGSTELVASRRPPRPTSMIAASPKHFHGLGMVPIQDVELAVKRLGDIRALGLCGVEIGTHLSPLLAAVERRRDLVSPGNEHALAELVEELRVVALLDEQRARELHREALARHLQMCDQIPARGPRVDRLHP